MNKEAEHNEDVKQAARDFFRQLEQHESEAVSLWQKFREITVDEYQHVYKVQPSGLNNSELTPRSETLQRKFELGEKKISANGINCCDDRLSFDLISHLFSG